jgi:hypothetical protein
MPFVFDATPSGVSANSWATAAEADDYFGGRRDASPWTNLASASEKEIVLADATLDLESLDYESFPAVVNQRLKVPRALLYDTDDRPLTTNPIPEVFKRALFEHALFKLNQGRDTAQPTGLEQFASIAVPGAISITLREGTSAPVFASRALALLAPYLVSVPGQTRVVRT